MLCDDNMVELYYENILCVYNCGGGSIDVVYRNNKRYYSQLRVEEGPPVRGGTESNAGRKGVVMKMDKQKSTEEILGKTQTREQEEKHKFFIRVIEIRWEIERG